MPSAQPMSLEKYDRLARRDFDNGAVQDEIRAALKDREQLRLQQSIREGHMRPGERELDDAHCTLHNLGASLTGNTQDSDVTWLAQGLYHRTSSYGMAIMSGQAIENEEFEQLGLTPDRIWTSKRWETLSDEERQAWIKFARATIDVMPHFAERVGHRFIKQSLAIRQIAKETHQQDTKTPTPSEATGSRAVQGA